MKKFFVKLICKYCKKEFIVTGTAKTRKYCSKTCYYLSKVGNKCAGQFKKGQIPWNKDKKLSDKTRKKISLAVKKQTRWYKYTKEAKNKMRKALRKHHIDLSHLNECDSNLLYLSLAKHNSLHQKAYDYLVKFGMINNYIAWFIKEFKPKLYNKNDYKKQQKFNQIDKEKRSKQRKVNYEK